MISFTPRPKESISSPLFKYAKNYILCQLQYVELEPEWNPTRSKLNSGYSCDACRHAKSWEWRNDARCRMKCPCVIKIQGFWNDTPRWLVNSNQLVGGPCYLHLQGPRKDSPKPRWEPQTSKRPTTPFVVCSMIPSERLRDWNSLKLRWSSNEANTASEWVLEGDGGKDWGTLPTAFGAQGNI